YSISTYTPSTATQTLQTSHIPPPRVHPPSPTADITGYFLIRLGVRLDFPIPDDRPNVARWYEDVAARPSTRA
ncbi:MAG: hypothetical protein OXC14_16870, partial [Rhodospirillaceae bacterium]|nr:hypothetical protein [Rhodospirillaceae bacterium]